MNVKDSWDDYLDALALGTWHIKLIRLVGCNRRLRNLERQNLFLIVTDHLGACDVLFDNLVSDLCLAVEQGQAVFGNKTETSLPRGTMILSVYVLRPSSRA